MRSRALARSMDLVLKLEKGKYLPSCQMCYCCEGVLRSCPAVRGMREPAVKEGLPSYALRLQQASAMPEWERHV